MADSHHHDPIADNMGTHPVKLAIVIVIGAVALIIGIIMVVNYAIGSYGSRSLKNEPSMSEAAVARRIAPVAQVVVDPDAKVTPVAAPAAGAAPTAVASVAIPAAMSQPADAGASGKATYDSACVACHSTGAANAPKLGDRAAWAPRVKTGMEALYVAAIKGKGAMPAKGGNPATPDAAVKAAVDYMVAAAK